MVSFLPNDMNLYIGLAYGLVLNRWQAITWTHVNSGPCGYMASQGHHSFGLQWVKLVWFCWYFLPVDGIAAANIECSAEDETATFTFTEPLQVGHVAIYW